MAFNNFQAALDAVDRLINYMEEKNFLNKQGFFIFFISRIHYIILKNFKFRMKISYWSKNKVIETPTLSRWDIVSDDLDLNQYSCKRT